MAVDKINGFAAPYKSQTFRDLVHGQVGVSGLAAMQGAVEQSGSTITVPEFTFFQDGLYIHCDEKTLSVPSMEAPYYLVVSAPTSQRVDDLIFTFAKSPADLSPNEVVIGAYDGIEWRKPAELAVSEVYEDLDKANLDFRRVGPHSGLVTTFDGAGYKTGAGVLVDRQGRRQTFTKDISFAAQFDDPAWSRVDRVVFRRPDDSPNRIGQRRYLVGGAFAAAPAARNLTGTLPVTYVHQATKILVDQNNDAHIFAVRGTAEPYQLIYKKVAADRTTTLVAETELSAELYDISFDVVMDSTGKMYVVYLDAADNVNLQRVDNDGALLGTSVLVDQQSEICKSPSIAIDPFDSRVFIVYQVQKAIGNDQIYFTTFDLGGTRVTGSKQLTDGTGNLGNPDIVVTDDLVCYVAWEDLAFGRVYFQRFDDIGVSLGAATKVSGATDRIGYGTLIDGATKPRIAVADNKQVFVTFLQDKGTGDLGLSVWTEGAAFMQYLSSSAENLRCYDFVLDPVFNGLSVIAADGDGVFYAKLRGQDRRILNVLAAADAPSVSLVLDNYGALLHAYCETLATTYSSYDTASLLYVGEQTVTGSFNAIDLEANQFMVASADVTPAEGDNVDIVDGVNAENSGLYSITAVELVSLNGVDDRWVVTTSHPGFTTESPALDAVGDFQRLEGNAVYFVETTSETQEDAYSYDSLRTDVLLARLVSPSNVVLNYVAGAGEDTPPVLLPYGPDVSLDWGSTAPNELTLSGGLKIIDLARNFTYDVADGSYPMAEGTAIYAELGDEAAVTPQVTLIENLPFGNKIEVLGVRKDGKFQAKFLGLGGVGQLDAGEQVILGEDLPQTLRSKLGFQSETVIEDYSSTIGYAASANYPTAISETNIMAGQNRHIRLVRARVSWGTPAGTFAFGSDGYLQVPGLPEARNRIPSGTSVTLADGEVAYVNVNRTGTTPADLTVSKAAASSLVLGRNTVILARCIGSRLLLEQNGVRLEAGYAVDLEAVQAKSVELETGGFIGTLGEADTDLQQAMHTVDRYFRALQLREHPTDKARVVITGAEHLKTDGTTLAQLLKKYLVDFSGAEIDFEEGTVYAADGTTVLSSFTLGTPIEGESWWYAVGLSADAVQADKTISVKVVVIPAESATARAEFKGDIKLGQVVTTKTELSIEDILQGHITQLGVGSGAGGDGGDPSFVPQGISGSVMTLAGGEIETEDKRTLVTGNGTTAAAVGFGNDIQIDLDSVSVSPAVPTSDLFYLCIDLFSLVDETLTDDGRVVQKVYGPSHFKLLGDIEPANIDRYRYVPVAFAKKSGSAWSGTGAFFGSTPRRLHLMPTWSPVLKFEEELTTETTTTFNHGLGADPDIVIVRFFDGTDTGGNLGGRVIDVNETSITVSSLGLDFTGPGAKLIVRALRLETSASSVVTHSNQFKSSWMQDNTLDLVGHKMTDMDDILSYSVLVWDLTTGRRYKIDPAQLVTGFDDTYFYLDWTGLEGGLAPSADLRYRIVAGGAALPVAIPEDTSWRYNKIVGDQPGEYPSLTAAAPTAGDRILVAKSYSVSVQEEISSSDLRIDFKAGEKITCTAGITPLLISGSNVELVNPYLVMTGASAAPSAVQVTGDKNRITGLVAELAFDSSGTALANAVDLPAGADANIVEGAVRITTGTLTNAVANAGADNRAELTVTGYGTGAMTTFLGFTRILVPQLSASAAGSEALDCAKQHLFLKTGGTATLTFANLAEGQTVNVVVSSTGAAYTLTWSPTVKWAGAAVPPPTSVAGRYDVYTFIKLGGMIFGTAALNMG